MTCQKNIEKHKDWADKSNFGVAHFGANPKLFPFCTIAFDNLHCRLSIVRSVWAFSRTYLEGYVFEMNEKIVSILKTELEDHCIECYECNKSLSVTHGEQIDKFIQLMPNAIKFLQEHLEETSTVQYIIKLLNIYPQLDSFMRI